MKRLSYFVCAAVCAAVLLTAAIASFDSNAVHVDAAETREAPISVVDDAGHQISLRASAKRIAALSPAITEILFAVGCGDRIVLRDRASDFPPRARALPATDPFLFPIEQIAGFRPDLILAGPISPEQLRAAKGVGLSIATFDPKSMEGVLDTINRIGGLCGAQIGAKRETARLRRRIANVVRRVREQQRPTVFVEVAADNPLRPWTAGDGSFVDHLLTLAGAKNVVTELGQPYGQIGVEQVLMADPQYIVVCRQSNEGGGRVALADRPGWGRLRAVKAGRVIDHIDADLLVRPGPRLVDGLEQLAMQIHPKVFRRGFNASR